jgi:protein ImuB
MFAAILLPEFRLQAALRMRPELCTRPVAIVDERDSQGVVLERSPAAAQAGVAVGMPSPQALARCGEVVLLPRARAQEASVQAALIEIACSLSPEVEATADGWTTIDLRMATIRDPQPAIRNALDRLATLELQARAGIGPNPDLAYLAARRAQPVLAVSSPAAFLAQLALAEIEPPPHLLALLHDWGIHTLGQLTSLPRGELADRLGPEADRLWQRAAGQTSRLLRLVRPVEACVEAFDFEREIETTEPLLFLLRRFVEQLALRLAGAHRVAARMTLTLVAATSSSPAVSAASAPRGETPLELPAAGTPPLHTRTFTIPSPTAEADVLFRILSTYLEDLRLDQRPTGVRLQIEPALANYQQLRLFENALRDANRFGETVARLAALVGGEKVGVAEIEDTHRADRFRMAEPKFHALRETEAPDDATAIGLPLRRFRPPIAAQVQVQRHEPVQLESGIARGRIIAALGPYRTGGGWWDREAWVDEEWDVQLAAGGLYRLCRRDRSWWVEGCYDQARSAAPGSAAVPVRHTESTRAAPLSWFGATRIGLDCRAGTAAFPGL